MADFLLELLSEEIPARMQDKASADLARLFAEEIARSGLVASAVEVYATPRRLALTARGLPETTAVRSEEIKGPRSSAPPQALEGFLRKTGLTRGQLVERDGTLFAVIEQAGRGTSMVLAEAIPAIVRAFPWPKSMRWGSGSMRWVRPLQGVVALLDQEVVPFEIEGIASGAETVGHRFHHPGIVTIGGAADYAAKLRACHVILDPAERQEIIREGAAKLAAEAGLAVVPDEGLVAENAGLTEWPVPLLGHFDPAFLEVPREVIQLTMRTNQKYFALTRADGSLAPNFICTANIEAADGGAAIAAGNARVLSARLSDAKFFWELDLKTPLAEQARKLDQIVFHEKLGTVADKVERVAKLARWLVEEGIVGLHPAPPERSRGTNSSEAENGAAGEEKSLADARHSPSTALGRSGGGLSLADMAEQAARLCKADLVTAMVGEFPELQGVMGGYYARAEGLSDEVADAIRDHYKPVGQGDGVPTAPVTVAVSLADKLDTIAGFFSIDERPSGSRDPFALRRAAIGVIALILASGLRFNLRAFAEALMTLRWTSEFGRDDIRLSYRLSVQDGVHQFQQRLMDIHIAGAGSRLIFGLLGHEKMTAYAEREVTDALDFAATRTSSVIDFFAERLKVQQREAGVRHDLIDAVFALGGEDDLVRLLARVKALQAFVATEEGANLLAGYKRAANILRAEAKRDGVGEVGFGSFSYTPEPAEAALAAALDAAIPRAADAVEREDFAEAMGALAVLRPVIDRFFDEVTVNDPDRDKRAARLGLLEKVRAAVHKVADFSRIEG